MLRILKAWFDASNPEYEIPEEPDWFDEDEVGCPWEECFFLFPRRYSDDYDE